MVCLEYVVAALQSPRVDGEKTTTLVVHGRETWKIIRYDRYVVIERNGRCRVYDEDDVADVLRTELRDVVRVEKFKFIECGSATRGPGDVTSVKTHFEHFDADAESSREARLSFTTKRGLITNSLVVAYDGEKFVATHRSDVTVARHDALETVTTFESLQSALKFVEDHLSFRDDAVTVDLGRVTKIVEIKILNV